MTWRKADPCPNQPETKDIQRIDMIRLKWPNPWEAIKPWEQQWHSGQVDLWGLGGTQCSPEPKQSRDDKREGEVGENRTDLLTRCLSRDGLSGWESERWSNKWDLQNSSKKASRSRINDQSSSWTSGSHAKIKSQIRCSWTKRITDYCRSIDSTVSDRTDIKSEILELERDRLSLTDIWSWEQV